MEEKKKKQRNPHLIGKKSIKVQALRNGWFNDDQKIEGEIFTIEEKMGLQRINSYSDYTEDLVVTVADQFSKFWMIELENDSGLDANDEEHNTILKEAKAKADKLRAKDSEESLNTLTKQPVVKKPLPKKAVKKTVTKKVVTKKVPQKTAETTVEPTDNGENVI